MPTPTHTQRRGRRFSYYVSHRLIAGGADPSGWRLPAPAIEAAVRDLVTAHLRDAAERHALLVVPDARQATTIAHRLHLLLEQIKAEPGRIGDIVGRIDLQAGSAHIRLSTDPIAAALGVASDDLAADLLVFDRPLSLRRRGVEVRIVTGVRAAAPDPVLTRVLAEARRWAVALRAGTSLTALATRTGYSKSYLRARLPLAFLAPPLQVAILEGRQSPDLSVARLLREGIPPDWADQERRFGHGSASL